MIFYICAVDEDQMEPGRMPIEKLLHLVENDASKSNSETTSDTNPEIEPTSKGAGNSSAMLRKTCLNRHRRNTASKGRRSIESNPVLRSVVYQSSSHNR